MMAKGFGGGAAPRPTMNGSPGGIRPMPNPALAAPQPMQGQQSGGMLAQAFGPQGSSTRYEMAMELLKSAMSGAAGSNSPALAFLTPIIGSAVGARVSKLRDDAMQSEATSMTEGLLGGPLNPQAQQAMAVLNNPDAPDYLKTIAAAMFKQNAVPVGQMAAPPRRAGGGGSRSGGGGKPAGGGRPTRFTYQQREADGRWTGFNPATGKREYMPSPEDPNATPTPAAASPAAPSLPPLPADPVLPRDPATGGDDDLINKYLGN